MYRRRLLLSVIASALLALAAAAPVAAREWSCVGWFASTNAQENGRDFGGMISFLAHDLQPFGSSTVAPFAHIALEDCQGE